MLVRLMYASRAVAALDPEELQVILRQSRTNNPPLGVTGVLCVCGAGNVLLQVLEGGRNAVSRLFQRIAADRRHQAVELLAFDEIAERRFAGWAMGQVDMARLNPALLLKYSEKPLLDPFTLPASGSLALLLELAATASVLRSGG